MILAIKIILVLSLFKIFLEDFKERQVALYLFLLITIIGGSLHFLEGSSIVFLNAVLINLSILSFLVFILWMYAKFRIKKSLKDTFGLGDLFFFLFLGISFPTATFLVLFSFSLFFSLILFLILKKNLKINTVPLAGFQAIFIAFLFIFNSVFNLIDLYMI